MFVLTDCRTKPSKKEHFTDIMDLYDVLLGIFDDDTPYKIINSVGLMRWGDTIIHSPIIIDCIRYTEY